MKSRLESPSHNKLNGIILTYLLTGGMRDDALTIWQGEGNNNSNTLLGSAIIDSTLITTTIIGRGHYSYDKTSSAIAAYYTKIPQYVTLTLSSNANITFPHLPVLKLQNM